MVINGMEEKNKAGHNVHVISFILRYLFVCDRPVLLTMSWWCFICLFHNHWFFSKSMQLALNVIKHICTTFRPTWLPGVYKVKIKFASFYLKGIQWNKLIIFSAAYNSFKSPDSHIDPAALECNYWGEFAA